MPRYLFAILIICLVISCNDSVKRIPVKTTQLAVDKLVTFTDGLIDRTTRRTMYYSFNRSINRSINRSKIMIEYKLDSVLVPGLDSIVDNSPGPFRMEIQTSDQNDTLIVCHYSNIRLPQPEIIPYLLRDSLQIMVGEKEYNIQVYDQLKIKNDLWRSTLYYSNHYGIIMECYDSIGGISEISSHFLLNSNLDQIKTQIEFIKNETNH
ncbi:MAG: hypothetical protein HRT58_16540 [Crocinitomicaceae bacterium]|nr:hypothetical protein [Flavobacteriales bacterium]NQZ37275.1 hypothetical protein [Crocinitomicaceae bacterium]